MSGYLRRLVLRSLDRGSMVEPPVTGPTPLDTAHWGPASAIDEPVDAPAGDAADRPTHSRRAGVVLPLTVAAAVPPLTIAAALPQSVGDGHVADNQRHPGSSTSPSPAPERASNADPAGAGPAGPPPTPDAPEHEPRKRRPVDQVVAARRVATVERDDPLPLRPRPSDEIVSGDRDATRQTALVGPSDDGRSARRGPATITPATLAAPAMSPTPDPAPPRTPTAPAAPNASMASTPAQPARENIERAAAPEISTLEVTIGRIEVTAATPTPRSARRRWSAAPMTLSEYLDRATARNPR